jgi:predicted HicB family RNase H-like nuclease
MSNPNSLEDIANRKKEKKREKDAAQKARKPDEKRLNAEIPKRLHAAIKAQAGVQRRTMKDIVKEALDNWMADHAEAP